MYEYEPVDGQNMSGAIPSEALAKLDGDARQMLYRLRYVQHDREKRNERFPPLVLEFAGCPKSGKSTTIEIVQHFLRRMEFLVVAPSEGASKRNPYHLRRDLVAYNAWTLNYAISELLVSYYNVDAPDIILLDRGIFDSLAWMGLLQQRGVLNKHEAEIIRRFAMHPRWAKLVSRLYLFTCKPEVSLARETASKLTTVGGTAMNPDLLRVLLMQYEQLASKLSDQQYQVLPIDTTEPGPPQLTAYTVVQDILRMWEMKLQ